MSMAASRASFSDDTKMIKKAMPKSLLLRDYLRDDMSSCSSNGFRSYPRRQCFTTVRFPVEMDLNKTGKLPVEQKQRRSILESKTKWKSKSKPKPKPKQLSVLKRASSVMINAFKHFWKKTDHQNKVIKRLKSFGDFINEKETTPPPSPSKFATTTTAELNNSSEVTIAQKDVNDTLDFRKTTNGKGVGATTATATTTATNYSPTTDNAKWQNEQDEQFSPVSVMDFPCDNDDESEGSSEFPHRHLETKGIKKLVFKTRRFKGAPQLEPFKLEDRIAQMGLESSVQTCYELDREENKNEKKAMSLLQLMKSTVSSHDLFKYEVVESLLLGFFKDRMIEQNVSHYEMLRTAKDWMDGQIQEMVLDWESKKNRETYIREIEKGVNWSKYDDEVEKENVALELEYEIFTTLIDDILFDFNL